MRFAALLAAVALTAPVASAQLAVLPYAGYDLEAPNPLVGLGVEIGLPTAAPVALAVRASGEFVVPAEFDRDGRVFNKEVLQGNLDVVASFGAGVARPYVGAGVSFVSLELDTADDDAVEGDLDSSSRSVGGNVLAGATFGSGLIAPFAQARASIGDRTAVTVSGGLRIGF
ncbi:hypothetical protein [Rubrivirga sp. IMCC45206]|uniref:hypothetical protein n=1 Tax=Rubrivirga sp. IMCC45206 TaxID=3391614 RepID=UPI0039903229